MLSGGAGIDMGTIGALARTMAPAGGVAPLAGQVEYRWPISPREERDAAPDDSDLLALLGSGDLRDQARDIAMTAPLAELRDAFRLAAGLSGWADDACTAVEREIAAGQLGEAARNGPRAPSASPASLPPWRCETRTQGRPAQPSPPCC
jgi:hypothetical protein